MSRTQVQLWYNRFNKRRENINHNARPSRPSTLTTDDNIEALKKLILYNSEVADDVDISFGLCQAILTSVKF